MFLHIGENKTIREKEIIGIFDSDNTTVSKITKQFLNISQKNGILETVGDLPKSFIVTDKNVYFTQLSVKTLAGRADNSEISERK